jgi:heme/copper-type cytochrome/quinol oxidase subunit 3
VARNGPMIPHPLKAELAAAEEAASSSSSGLCAIADLAAYARSQHLTMADELLTELLALLFVAQLSASNNKRMGSEDCA